MRRQHEVQSGIPPDTLLASDSGTSTDTDSVSSTVPDLQIGDEAESAKPPDRLLASGSEPCTDSDPVISPVADLQIGAADAEAQQAHVGDAAAHAEEERAQGVPKGCHRRDP